MDIGSVSVWEITTAQEFASVVAAIDDLATMQKFLRDVMTEKEIIEISSRLEAARMLQEGKKYIEVIAKTKLSSRTVARISNWMHHGCGGYETALGIMHEHDEHQQPAHS